MKCLSALDYRFKGVVLVYWLIHELGDVGI